MEQNVKLALAIGGGIVAATGLGYLTRKIIMKRRQAKIEKAINEMVSGIEDFVESEEFKEMIDKAFQQEEVEANTCTYH